MSLMIVCVRYGMMREERHRQERHRQGGGLTVAAAPLALAAAAAAVEPALAAVQPHYLWTRQASDSSNIHGESW